MPETTTAAILVASTAVMEETAMSTPLPITDEHVIWDVSFAPAGWYVEGRSQAPDPERGEVYGWFTMELEHGLDVWRELRGLGFTDDYIASFPAVRDCLFVVIRGEDVEVLSRAPDPESGGWADGPLEVREASIDGGDSRIAYERSA